MCVEGIIDFGEAKGTSEVLELMDVIMVVPPEAGSIIVDKFRVVMLAVATASALDFVVPSLAGTG